MKLKIYLQKKFNRVSILKKCAGILHGIILNRMNNRVMRGIEDSIVSPSYAPVFIIGVPRSGTTILYQMITNEFMVAYINNFMHGLYRIPALASRLSLGLFGTKAHNSFTSNLGDTSSSGWLAPSECGDFWYQYLDREDVHVQPENISRELKKQLRENLMSISVTQGMPLVLKNNFNTTRLRLIAEVFPEAKIIYLDRSNHSTCSSLLKARQKVGDPKQWFSTKIPNYETLEKLSPEEQVVEQVFGIKSIVDQDLSLFPENQVFRLRYEDLDGLKGCPEQLREFIYPNLKRREDAVPIEIKVSQKTSSNTTLANLIKEREKSD